MIKVICLDLDGTLLNSESKMTKVDMKAIDRCIDHGIKVIISTGKTFNFVSTVISDLGLQGLQVASNGAAVINEIKEKVWITKILPETYISLIGLLREKSRSTVVHHLDGHIYCEDRNPYLEVIAGTGEVLTRVDDLAFEEIAGGVLMLTYEGTEGDELHRGLLDNFSGKLRIRKGAPCRMDVYSAEAGKVNAVKKILEIYGIKRGELMAVGDSENDIGLIKFAGVGVAMGNSPESVKSAADFIVSDNDSNGVADAINRIIFNG